MKHNQTAVTGERTPARDVLPATDYVRKCVNEHEQLKRDLELAQIKRDHYQHESQFFAQKCDELREALERLMFCFDDEGWQQAKVVIAALEGTR